MSINIPNTPEKPKGAKFDQINYKSDDGKNLCYKSEKDKENCGFLWVDHYDKKRKQKVAFCAMFGEAKAKHPVNIMTQKCAYFKSIKQMQNEINKKKAARLSAK